jgi:hypothetical protein
LLPRTGKIAPQYTFERGYPTPETSQRARDDADFQRAVIAYRFWYPTFFAAVHESATGPKQTLAFALRMSAFGCKADIALRTGP